MMAFSLLIKDESLSLILLSQHTKEWIFQSDSPIRCITIIFSLRRENKIEVAVFDRTNTNYTSSP